MLKEASLGAMKGIIKYGDEPLVVSDYAGPMNHQLWIVTRLRVSGITLLASLPGMTMSGVIAKDSRFS